MTSLASALSRLGHSLQPPSLSDNCFSACFAGQNNRSELLDGRIVGIEALRKLLPNGEFP